MIGENLTAAGGTLKSLDGLLLISCPLLFRNIVPLNLFHRFLFLAVVECPDSVQIEGVAAVFTG